MGFHMEYFHACPISKNWYVLSEKAYPLVQSSLYFM